MDTKPYINQNKDRFINELFELLRIPSISADPAYNGDVIKTAEAVRDSLEAIGMDHAQLCETPGYPVVYAEKIIDPSLPTVLVYGHYDVQPPDPVDLWTTAPFEPEIRTTEIHPEGAIFARGACDDKGQFFMHVKAVECMMQNGGLPCNVKFMIEGEEEVGSENLDPFLEKYREMLEACSNKYYIICVR